MWRPGRRTKLTEADEEEKEDAKSNGDYLGKEWSGLWSDGVGE